MEHRIHTWPVDIPRGRHLEEAEWGYLLWSAQCWDWDIYIYSLNPQRCLERVSSTSLILRWEFQGPELGLWWYCLRCPGSSLKFLGLMPGAFPDSAFLLMHMLWGGGDSLSNWVPGTMWEPWIALVASNTGSSIWGVNCGPKFSVSVCFSVSVSQINSIKLY